MSGNRVALLYRLRVVRLIVSFRTVNDLQYRFSKTKIPRFGLSSEMEQVVERKRSNSTGSISFIKRAFVSESKGQNDENLAQIKTIINPIGAFLTVKFAAPLPRSGFHGFFNSKEKLKRPFVEKNNNTFSIARRMFGNNYLVA